MENSQSDSPSDSPIRASALVNSPPRTCNRNQTRRSQGEKVVIRLDDYNQPVSPKKDVIDLSSDACKLARREIPIIYGDFREVPSKYYENIIEGLNEHYAYENHEEDGVDCAYIREKVKDAWRNFKSGLKRKRVDGKDPALVKLEDAPKGHPAEDWRVFIDNCNTVEMQIASTQNSENRGNCKLPNCTGRIPTQVVRRDIAKKKGIPDSQVGLGTLYREMHTKKKDKALGNAGATVIGDGSMGRRRAIGAGVPNSVAKKMAPIMKRREVEDTIWKNKLESKIDGLATIVSEFIKSSNTNHIQSLSQPRSGPQYVRDKPVNFTQTPSMSPSGQHSASPADNIQRTTMPPSEHVDASVTASMPRRGHHYDGHPSSNNDTRTTRPTSGYSPDVSASMPTSPLLSADHVDVGSSSVNNPRGEHTHMNEPRLMGNKNKGKKVQAKSLLSCVKASTGTVSGQKVFLSPSQPHGSKATAATPRSTPSPIPISKSIANKEKELQTKKLFSCVKASTGTVSAQEDFISPSQPHGSKSTTAAHSSIRSPTPGSKFVATKLRSTPSLTPGSKAMAPKQSSTPSKTNPSSSSGFVSSLVSNTKKPVEQPNGPQPNGGAVMENLNQPKIVTCDARQLIGMRVKVRGGWPSKLVALGVIKAVDPTTKFEGRRLGIGYFLIYINTVQCPNFELPVPHGQWTTLGQLGAGCVIWPKDDIKLINHS